MCLINVCMNKGVRERGSEREWEGGREGGEERVREGETIREYCMHWSCLKHIQNVWETLDSNGVTISKLNWNGTG